MAVNALDEKIIQIRLKNEEIKRRYEEVEADKKNAAKLNALVQMVPSSDWPERKEPPEFTRKETSKSNSKPKPVKEHTDRLQQYLIGGAEGKKIHKFAQGDGPPPDPKYNFLADSEREENNIEGKRDEEKHKGPNKYVRNGPRKRGGGRDGYQKDYRKVPTGSRDGSLPEYDAWRAERNRIDEARISRQRTAEGNWRREWDNDKVNVEKESSKKDPRFSSGDTSRRDYKEFEKRHQFDAEHSNRVRGANHRNSYGPKSHSHYDNHQYDYQNDHSEATVKGPLSPIDDRTVIATDKSIKVTVNHGTTPTKGPVMSVKVNAPSIAGTGRVGPRQKTRVTYSSQSETEVSTHQIDHFSRQKSFDEKTHFNNTQRSIAPKSPFMSRKKENSNKSPYLQRKDTKRDDQSMRSQGEKILKSPSPQKKKFKDTQKAPQAQMQFFTSSSHGLVSSRGRGQKQLNDATCTVIKILGQNTDKNERSIAKHEEILVDKTTKISDDNVAENTEIVQNDEIIKNSEIIEKVENKNIDQGAIADISLDTDVCNEVKNEIVMNESDDFLIIVEKDLEKFSDTICNISKDDGDDNLTKKIENNESEIKVITKNFETKTLNEHADEINNLQMNIETEKSDFSKNTQIEGMDKDAILGKSESDNNSVEIVERNFEEVTKLDASENNSISNEIEENKSAKQNVSLKVEEVTNLNPSISEEIEESKSTEQNSSLEVEEEKKLETLENPSIPKENEESKSTEQNTSSTVEEVTNLEASVNHSISEEIKESKSTKQNSSENKLETSENPPISEENEKSKSAEQNASSKVEEVTQMDVSENHSKEIEESKSAKKNASSKVEEVNICSNASIESKIENSQAISKLQIPENVSEKASELKAESSRDHVLDNVSSGISHEASCVSADI